MMRSAAIGCMVIYGLATLAAVADGDACTAQFDLDGSSYSKLQRSDVTGCCRHWAPSHDSCDGDILSCEHKCVSWRRTGGPPPPTTEECKQKCEQKCGGGVPAPSYCSEWTVVRGEDYDADEWPLHTYQCTNRTTTKPTPPDNGVCECLEQVDKCKRIQLEYNRARDYVDRCTHNIREGAKVGLNPPCHELVNRLWDKKRQYCDLKSERGHSEATINHAITDLEYEVNLLMASSQGKRHCPKAKQMCRTEMLNCADSLCDELQQCHKRIQTCLKRLE